MFGKMKVVLLILTVGLVSVFWLTAATNERAGKVLIKFNEDVSSEQISSLTKELGLVKVKTFAEINVQVFRISSDYSVEEIIKFCSNASIVKYAEPTAEVRAFSNEASPEASNPEPVMAVQAQLAEHRSSREFQRCDLN